MGVLYLETELRQGRAELLCGCTAWHLSCLIGPLSVSCLWWEGVGNFSIGSSVINQSLLLFLGCFSASVTDGKSDAWRPWCFSPRQKDCCSPKEAASWGWLLRFPCTIGAARSMWLAELCGVMHGPLFHSDPQVERAQTVQPSM